VPAQRHSARAAAPPRDVEVVQQPERHAAASASDARDVEVVDQRIAEVASRQHGAISRTQLLAVGAIPAAIKYRVRAGRLHPAHRGVYLVGHTALAPLAREAAALLATGPGSALGHRSAAKLHRLLPLDALAEVDVTVTSQRRARDGVNVRRGALTSQDVQKHDGLWVTTPRRTLVDLRRTTDRRTYERAAAEAQILRLVPPEPDGPQPTRSEAERVLARLVREARLPLPSMNVPLLGFEVDALWPAQRLVVEVDSFAFHRTRRAWERDHRKTAALEAADYRVLRITWSDLTDERLATAARLARALSSPG
jgi:very-short-patch-repair endonuclease